MGANIFINAHLMINKTRKQITKIKFNKTADN